MSGGSLFILNSSVSINNCKVTRNYALYGGGIYMHKESRVKLVNTNFTHNAAFKEGGAIITHQSQLQLFSTIIQGNSGDTVGDLYCESSRVTIENATDLYYDGTQTFTGYRGLKINNVNITKSRERFGYNVMSILLGSFTVDVYIKNVNITLLGGKDKFQLIYFEFNLRPVNISLDYTCPINFYATSHFRPSKYDNRYPNTFSCAPCSRGTYRLNTSTQRIQIGKVNKIMNLNKQCLPCPVGGNCDGKLKSKDRFWGYIKEKPAFSHVRSSIVVLIQMVSVQLVKAVPDTELEKYVVYAKVAIK